MKPILVLATPRGLPKIIAPKNVEAGFTRLNIFGFYLVEKSQPKIKVSVRSAVTFILGCSAIAFALEKLERARMATSDFEV